jgi:tetratricopeptide (TPR) repeat protein
LPWLPYASSGSPDRLDKHQRAVRCFVSILAAVLLTAACTQDPNVLKKRYLESGDRYFAKQMYRQASIMYRTALKKDPRYGIAYYRDGVAAIRMHQFGPAETSFRRALELLPEGPERVVSRVQLADIYIAYILDTEKRDHLMIQEVDRLCEQLLTLDPDSFDGHRLSGTVSTLKSVESVTQNPRKAASEIQKSIAHLRAADALRPYQPEVVGSLTRALWVNGQAPEAEKYLQGLLRAKPSFAAGYLELNRYYVKTNRLKDAEEILERAIANMPERVEFLSQLAELYQRSGRRVKMAKTLERLKAKAPNSPDTYDLSARLFLKAGAAPQAILECEEGIRRFPKDQTRYRKTMIDALLAQNKRTEAIALNDRILKDQPNDADALARQGEFALQTGEVSKAIASLDALLQRAPDHPRAHYDMGRALVAANRVEAARVQFTEAIHWAHDFIPPRVALAKIQINAGEYGQAVVSADAILAIDPRHGEAGVLRAIALRALGKPDEARAEINTLLVMYPRYDQALFQLGEVNAADHKWKEAEAAYRRSYEANPGNIQGLLAIGNFEMVHDQAEEAVEMLRAEAKKFPDRLDLRLAHGAMAGRAGHVEEAASEYKFLLGRLDKNPKALAGVNLRLGELYFRSGDIPQSLGYLEKAKQLQPDDSAALHSLGVAYDVAGRKKEAAALYDACLKIDGENPVVMNNLAYYISQNGGNLDLALKLAQRAHRSMPNEPGFSDTVACIYLKKNLVANAIEILEELVGKKPREAVFRMHLGEALLRKGDTANARKELQMALTSEPTSEDAVKIKTLLGKNGA